MHSTPGPCVGCAVGAVRCTTRRLYAPPRCGTLPATDHAALTVGGGVCRTSLLGVRGLEGAECGRADCPWLRLGVLAGRSSLRDLLAALRGDGRRGSLPLRRHTLGHPARPSDLAGAARCPVAWRHFDSGIGRALYPLPRAAITAARANALARRFGLPQP